MNFSKIVQTFYDYYLLEATLNGCIDEFFLQLTYSLSFMARQ